MKTHKMISCDFEDVDVLEIHSISDLHVGSPQANIRAFKKYLDEEILSNPNARVVVVGDVVDNGVKRAFGSVYEQIVPPQQQLDDVSELLYPIKDRILTMVSGNHEQRSFKDVGLDPMKYVALQLRIPHLYRPYLSFLKVKVGKRTNHNKRPPNYSIAVTHGTGASSRPASRINKNSDFLVNIGTDILITGHTHSPSVVPDVRHEVNMSRGLVIQRQQVSVTATSWLESGGYAEQAMLTPKPIAPNVIYLYGKEHRVEVLQKMKYEL